MESFRKDDFERLLEKHQDEIEGFKDRAEDIARRDNVIFNKVKESGEKFEILGTFQTGGKTGEELLKELEEKGKTPSDHASFILKNENFPTSKTGESIEFVSASVAELGFDVAATIEEIFQRGKEEGLELCEEEDAPNLDSQDAVKTNLSMAMKTLKGARGKEHVFVFIQKVNGPWCLDTENARPEVIHGVDDKFIFRRRK